MTADMPRVFVSLEEDASDVALALEVAGALWGKGDEEEAARWLRRAAEAAAGAGQADRAASLARGAEEIEAMVERRRTRTSDPPGAPPVHASRERMRMSVKVSVRDPNLYLLRPLPDGQAPPPGTHEGFLVLSDAPPEGTSGSNGGNISS